MNPPPPQLLTKGLEEEVYTGTPDGQIVGMSHKIKEALPGFTTEPDCRNTEFVTEPLRDYDDLACAVMTQRRRLRDWLKTQGPYTLIPGATLSTGDSKKFYISDESNAYYRYIRDTYFTNVVTASAHLNIGLDGDDLIVRASRVLRMEACLFLALTASSPFLDNRPTGYHSTRWRKFPHTPAYTPLFESPDHYRRFVHESIAAGLMQNSRHLWISARPNGLAVPEQINRVELRVCDKIDCPRKVVAVTALMEARLWQVMDDPSLDPLQKSDLPSSTRAEDLIAINDENNTSTARNSLNATVRHWRDGRRIPIADWLELFYREAAEAARPRGFASRLEPVRDILTGGNTAQRWLRLYRQGRSVADIIRLGIVEMEEAELALTARVC